LNLDNLTRDLIAIDSVTGNEDEVLKFIENYLRIEGYTHSIKSHNGGLIVGGDTKDSVVALVGHVDTVPKSKYQENLENSKAIYGRGAVDMKSGLSVIIQTLLDFQDHDIVGIFYKGEEGAKEKNGLETLFPEITRKFKISLGIIFEPTDNEVQLGCLGVINAELKLEGIEAHSARPWLGENAIYKTIPLLENLKKLSPESILVDELDYKEVVSVTTIYGGIAKNVIPGEVVCGINYRFAPDKTPKDAVAKITKLLSDYGELTIQDIAESAHPNKRNSTVQNFIKATDAIIQPKQAWTDIARFTNSGIPAVNFGPGSPNLAHKKNEHVITSDINKCYVSIKRFFLEKT